MWENRVMQGGTAHVGEMGFLAKNLSILYPSHENFTTGVAITCTTFTLQEFYFACTVFDVLQVDRYD